MLTLSPAVRVFLCLGATDMRRGFDGLLHLVQEKIREDPFSGHLFVFRNRGRDRLKVLYWARDGLAIWMKRLEKGVFRFPVSDQTERLEIDASDLHALLEGIDLRDIRREKRFRLPLEK